MLISYIYIHTFNYHSNTHTYIYILMGPGDISRDTFNTGAARIRLVATVLEGQGWGSAFLGLPLPFLMDALLVVFVHKLTRPTGFHPVLDNRFIILPFPGLEKSGFTIGSWFRNIYIHMGS